MKRLLLALLLLPSLAFGQSNPSANGYTFLGNTTPLSSQGQYTVWMNNATSPPTWEMYDGAANVPLGTMNTSTHLFCPISSVNCGPLSVSGLTVNVGTYLNTLSVSGAISGAGVTGLFASPFPIGGTTPSTGNFSNLTATTIEATSTITPNSVGGIVGTSAGDNAQAGSVGEVISGDVGFTPISSTSPANIVLITLSPGDWDVWGNVWFTTAGGAVMTQNYGWVSTVSLSFPASPSAGTGYISTASQVANGSYYAPTGTTRILTSTNTNVWLGAETVYGSGAASVAGAIFARRAR